MLLQLTEQELLLVKRFRKLDNAAKKCATSFLRGLLEVKQEKEKTAQQDAKAAN